MKIFITGGTGFIGSHVVRALHKAGHDLLCLVRETSDTFLIDSLDIPVYKVNIHDIPALRKGLRGCDAAVHLASIYSFWEPDPQIFQRINVEGTRAFFQAALEENVRRVVFVGSVVSYGLQPAPFDETATPGRPLSAYARSKVATQALADDFYSRGLPVVSLQPGSVVGAGDVKASGEYVDNVIEHRLPATGLKSSAITFVPAKDVAQAVFLALQTPDIEGEHILIGKETVTLDHYLKRISQLSGVRLPFMTFPNWLVMLIATLQTLICNLLKKPPLWGMSLDQARTFLHGFTIRSTKAENILGLQYSSLDQALVESVEWYLDYLQKKREKPEEISHPK